MVELGQTACLTATPATPPGGDYKGNSEMKSPLNKLVTWSEDLSLNGATPESFRANSLLHYDIVRGGKARAYLQFSIGEARLFPL